MLKTAIIDPHVKLALREDIGSRDITSAAVLSKDLNIKAEIEARSPGVLCGIEIAERAFRLVDEKVRFLPTAKDGEGLEAGREVAYVEGSAVSILAAERTALNYLCHLSGVATQTRRFVEKVAGTGVRILDSRKTAPGLRLMEKYAVRTGGGTNQRTGLFDQALIKDNHLRILRNQSLSSIVERVRRAVLKKTIVGVEVENLAEFREALKTSVDYILLDNFPTAEILEAVAMKKKIRSDVQLEVSGGVTLDNVAELARTGVDRISIGALTHSAPALDMALEIVT